MAPLPWYGITVSGTLQSLPGYVLGVDAMQYGVFTWGTGFETPNGQSTYWRVTPTTRYAANCTGACTPGALVNPNQLVSQLDVLVTTSNAVAAPAAARPTPPVTSIQVCATSAKWCSWYARWS